MSPRIGRRLHLILMLFWIIQLAVVWWVPANARVSYLIVVSIYANIVGHWSGWSAERPTEVV